MSKLSDIEYIKRWCLQDQSALSGRDVADAVIRMCDDITSRIQNTKGMFWTEDGGEVEIWYPDGDKCATIADNLGLGVSAEDVASLICDAIEGYHP